MKKIFSKISLKRLEKIRRLIQSGVMIKGEEILELIEYIYWLEKERRGNLAKMEINEQDLIARTGILKDKLVGEYFRILDEKRSSFLVTEEIHNFLIEQVATTQAILSFLVEDFTKIEQSQQQVFKIDWGDSDGAKGSCPQSSNEV